MSGLLDNSCSSLFFQMECDVYYAKESQDDYGSINKTWEFDSSRPCSFYTIADMSNTQNFTFDKDRDSRFYKLEAMLYGRFKDDVRKNSYGEYFPLSHILVTNIKDTRKGTEAFFIETNGDYLGKPTTFEIKTLQPFVGAFSTIEYYKIQLERSDVQGVVENDPC